MRATRLQSAPILSLALAALLVGLPARVSLAQTACLTSVNKAGAKVAAAHGKNDAACIKDAVKGALVGSADLCVGSDSNGKVAIAEQKVDRAFADKCSPPPGFGLTTAVTVRAAAKNDQSLLVEAVFGTPIDDAIVDAAADRAGARCQTGVAKAHRKLAATTLKAFNGCKKNGLKSGAIVDAAGLSACVGGDDRGRVASVEGKLTAITAKRCARVDLASAFPGSCSGAASTPPDLADCVAAVTRCRTCNMINAMDGLDADCEALDDGDPLNASCVEVALCGDGAATLAEQCDDGNLEDGDGCTSTCTCEPGSLAAGCSDAACPGSVELTQAAGAGAACTSNTDCAAGACDAGLARCITASERDIGWQGYAHEKDWNDGTRLRLKLSCANSPTCGTCAVLGIDPSAGNCRCSTDNRTLCNDPLSLSAADCSVGVSCVTDGDCRVCSQSPSIGCDVDNDCPSDEICLTGSRLPTCSDGQCVGTCTCYEGPPLPYSSSNVPSCVVRKFAADVSGTMDVDSGDRRITRELLEVVHLGELVTVPCPACGGSCTAPAASIGSPCVFDADCDVAPGAGDGACGNFDSVANDGIREGTCVFGDNEGQSCDAGARSQSFPAPGGGDTSLDCLPTTGKNVSGIGLQIAFEQTTGTASLDSDIQCGFTFLPELPPEFCPCGVCSGNSVLACSSDAACAEAGAGSCEKRAQGDPRPNRCSDVVCTDVGGGKGECAADPPDSYCDGLLLANGDPLVACLSNTDCAATNCGAVSCGSCTLSQPRRCFLDPITAAGAADAEQPLSVALYCAPPTASAGINVVHGLPGPVRETQQETATYFCAGDPGSTYTPGVGGCP